MRNMDYREIHDMTMDALRERPLNHRRLDALDECHRGEWLRFRLITDGRRNKFLTTYWER